MRPEPSVMHLDLDAFFAAVEQRDKPSLRGKPVVVGGIGGRGVVSTASYEARRYGIRSAMPTWEARRRAPGSAAFLAGRFDAYRASSRVVMGVLRRLSPVMQAVSVDEAYVDLAAVPGQDLSVEGVRATAEQVRSQIRRLTGGLTASVGIASSRMMAKIASELAKPDGVTVIVPGEEVATLHPLPVRAVGGIGPVTAERLGTLGVRTVGDLAALSEADLVATFGSSHGGDLYRMARAEDDRPVVIEAANRSVSVESTYPVDLDGFAEVERALEGLARRAAERLAKAGYFARTVTIKVRDSDFATRNRSSTLPQPTGDADVIVAESLRLARSLGVAHRVRLLGVGLSGLTEYAQEMLFATVPGESVPGASMAPARDPLDLYGPQPHSWRAGQDVLHSTFGAGWVWGSGLGRVTVRFEGPGTPPGAVRSFASDDPELHPGVWPRWWESEDADAALLAELTASGDDED